MSLLLLLVGLILVVTGVNGTTKDAGELIKADFTGPNNFIVWITAIIFAGALGYVPKLRPVSYGFLVLIFAAILLSSGSGFFDKFKQSLDELSSS